MHKFALHNSFSLNLYVICNRQCVCTYSVFISRWHKYHFFHPQRWPQTLALGYRERQKKSEWHLSTSQTQKLYCHKMAFPQPFQCLYSSGQYCQWYLIQSFDSPLDQMMSNHVASCPQYVEGSQVETMRKSLKMQKMGASQCSGFDEVITPLNFVVIPMSYHSSLSYWSYLWCYPCQIEYPDWSVTSIHSPRRTAADVAVVVRPKPTRRLMQIGRVLDRIGSMIQDLRMSGLLRGCKMFYYDRHSSLSLPDSLCLVRYYLEQMRLKKKGQARPMPCLTLPKEGMMNQALGQK